MEGRESKVESRNQRRDFSSRCDMWPDISYPQETGHASKVGLPNLRILVIGICMNAVCSTGPATKISRENNDNSSIRIS
jgi:hypothetical protein